MATTSLLNLGSQTVVWKYKTSLKGSNLSKLMNGCIAPGLYLKNGVPIEYNTGIATYTPAGSITLAPFEAVFRCVSDNKTIHIGTTESIVLSNYDEIGFIGSTKPYITMSYTWQDQVLNYINFEFKDLASLNIYDVVIGKAVFNGSNVDSIDYSVATYPPIYDPLTNTFKLRNLPPTIGSTGHASYKALYMDTNSGQLLIGT